MRLPHTRHAWLIARTEVRRTWRSLRGSSGRLALLAIAAMFIALFFLGVLASAYFLGSALRTGSIDLPIRYARGGAIGVVLAVAYSAGARAVQQTGAIDRADGILTTVASHDVVAGLVLSEFIRFYAILGVPIVVLAAAFAVGASSVASFVTAVVALVALVALGILIGYPLGLLVKLGFARSKLLARSKLIIGILAVVVYLWVIFGADFDAIVAPLLGVVGVVPIAWFADLALAFTPGVAVAWSRVIGALVTVVVGIPLLFAVSIRLAERLWYTDSVRPERSTGPTTNQESSATTDMFGGGLSGVSTGVLSRLVTEPTLAAARKSWLRARRAPIKLSYIIYPAFLLISPVQQAVQTGQIPATLPVLVGVYGAWMTGAAFALNPLGDEGAVLPVSLTATPASGRRLIRGVILSGVIGVPITVIATVVLGVFSSLSVLSVVATAVVGAVLCIGGAALAAGVGVAYPRLETVNITGSREAVVPSLSAFTVFTLVLFILSIPGLLSQIPFLAGALADVLGTSDTVVTVAGPVLMALAVIVVGWLSYRYAVQTLSEYTL
jgi:ABC-2 type transport system permease protein